MKQTFQIQVEEIRADLRRGIPDVELMKRYRVSEDGLKRLFDSLLEATCNGSRHVRVESDE